ncbi:MAG: hypothetical protein GY755_05720 [Chloroflexi bacterium]|nr:hypothetical protein [Chloroflexota bacterium]
MKKSKHLLISIFILSAIVLGACNLPTGESEEDAAATVIAETAASVFTQAAETAASTLPTATTAPEATATATNTLFPTSPAATATNTPVPCNRASFVKDVTYADNSEVASGAAFTKTWRIKNNGTCSWTSGYVLLFDSGDQMGAPGTATITAGTVAPGATVDISVDLTAPASPGTYQGKFKLRSPDNIVFGINADGQGPFWVKIVVPNPTATPTETTVPAAGDLGIIEIIMKTNFEVAVRVGATPIGSLSGNYQYTVYADGVQVQQGSCAIPSGSNLCSTGHIVSGSQSIQVVIDSDNSINETDEGNNSDTVTCDKAALACS